VRVTRTPLRITLGGGGSDLQPGGLCIAAAIDKYVTISATEAFEDGYILRYSELEHAKTLDDVRHGLLRACLSATNTRSGIEVASTSDIPSGTGLGSSGAFTVGVLKALCPELSKPALARLACDLDTGQQDQWAAVYGGVNVFDFAAQTIRPIATEIDRHLVLFYTGIRRHPNGRTQAKPKPRDTVNLELAALEHNDPGRLGWCLTQHWEAKLAANRTVEHEQFDVMIQAGIKAGAYGGKLIGAGGGGFLLFAVDDPDTFDLGWDLRRVPFRFDQDGCTVL
jgi:D-glycero-alpha-D-manno-heptose-7-phosphate kinase